MWNHCKKKKKNREKVIIFKNWKIKNQNKPFENLGTKVSFKPK